MTPLNEMPTEPKEKPKTDCAAVKAEWDAASATGHVSSDLMQKALECNLVPKEKVKGMPTGKETLPTRSENPLAGEDKELGMAELVMALDETSVTSADTGYIDDDEEAAQAAAQIDEDMMSTGYYRDDQGNWQYQDNTSSSGSTDFDPFRDSFAGRGTLQTQSNYSIRPPNEDESKKGYSNVPIEGWVAAQVSYQGKPITIYYDPKRPDIWSGNMGGGGSAGEGGRIMNTLNPNYFGGQAPQKPDDMGNMEWYYKYRGGMYQNAFNPESFYFNPDDKGNAGQTSSPYARIGNRGNLTPEIVKQNRPFYDAAGIDKYTNQDKLKYKNRMMQMAEVVSPGQDTPMGAAVDQSQGASQEVDEQVQEQLKEAISQAGFNVVDIAMSPEGKILVTVGQFEDSYIENAQYFEMDFELAEPMKCSKRFKAIAVTPGMYKAKDGTLVELSSQQLQGIAGLFRNKPLVLVDHDLARPDSTHEGKNVGFVEDSWYDPDYDAVIYKGVLGEDLDLAAIAGSSIKLTHGKTPMGRHIALIPKCVMGKACYAPQDPNAVILENAQKIGER